MNEFELIETYLAPLAGPEGLRLKDDAALFTPNPDHDLVITTDTFVEGVHFPNGQYGANVAERLLRTNLSDLAAKGGIPRGYLLAFTLPKSKMEQWLPAFAKGLETTQREFGGRLWGGDTTASDGAAVFSITLVGDVPQGQFIQRKGATLGDDIWVSGVLGDSMLGCRMATLQPIDPVPNGQDMFAFESAYWRPEPAQAYRPILLDWATASADISDGLLADAGHIAKASEICLTLNFDALPISNGAQVWADAQPDSIQARKDLISFGDDYGVVFTANPKNRQQIFDTAREQKLSLSLVGSVLPGSGCVCLDVDGQPMDWPITGYQHK